MISPTTQESACYPSRDETRIIVFPLEVSGIPVLIRIGLAVAERQQPTNVFARVQLSVD